MRGYILLTMKRILPSVILALCALACTTPVERSDRENLDFERGEAFFNALVSHPEAVPVTFTYNGKDYSGLGETTPISSEVKKQKDGTRARLSYKLDDALEIRLDAFLNGEFGEVEYTLWFENKSDAPSAVLEKVASINTVLPGGEPVLRGCLGDHGRNYSDYEWSFLQGFLRLPWTGTSYSFIQVFERTSKIFDKYLNLFIIFFFFTFLSCKLCQVPCYGLNCVPLFIC